MEEINGKILKEIFLMARNSSCYLKRDESTTKLPDKFFEVNDIASLEDKTDTAILDFIKSKFLAKQFYVWAGQALLAIHPYEHFEVPTVSNASIKQVISRAFYNMQKKLGKINQCIMISGDSGSGKTFSACLAINYLSQSQSSGVDVLWQAWTSVPLLTAFGNAPTKYNYNSSRFGKLLQIQYRDGGTVGTYLNTYLLEKSRVSGPNRGEGNFHIFGQILEYHDDKALEKIYLFKSTDYFIAPRGNITTRWLYDQTLKALNTSKIGHIEDILKILSIILNLGNVQFEICEVGFKVTDDSRLFLQNACKLLHCKDTELMNVFTKRMIAAKLRRCTICYSNCLNIEECEERKNSFIRFLYDKLFNWLVKQLNDKNSADIVDERIGILDIYGFESFSFNTFEQLCINYANERLHVYFVGDYLVSQQNILVQDGIASMNIDTSDYKARIDLLESIFAILNEECLLKRYNTEIFLASRLKTSLRDSRYFVNKKNEGATKFSIAHYNGPVEYDCKNILSKNRDKVPEEVISFLESCQNPFIDQLTTKETSTQDKRKTLLSKFKKSLDDLIATLQESNTHYIKCLKPNPQQMPGHLDEDFFKQQLNNNGILDIIQLSHQNYPIKLPKLDFLTQHTWCSPNILSKALDIHVGKKYLHFTQDSYDIIQTVTKQRYRVFARKIWYCWQEHRSRTNCKTLESVKRKFCRNFKRVDHLLTTHKLLEVPIRFHTRKTCIPGSMVLPRCELPLGLPDILI